MQLRFEIDENTAKNAPFVHVLIRGKPSAAKTSASDM
jgi:hypothetical protein